MLKVALDCELALQDELLLSISEIQAKDLSSALTHFAVELPGIMLKASWELGR